MKSNVLPAFYALVAFAGLILLPVLMPSDIEPDMASACRRNSAPPEDKLACLGDVAPTVLTAELSGEGKRWACQLFRLDPDTMSKPDAIKSECAGKRSLDLRKQYTDFDSRFLIPLYGTLSFLVAIWLGISRRGRRLSRLPVIFVVLSSAALIVLDVLENAHSVHLLDLFAQFLATYNYDFSGLDSVAATARAASLAKWSASAAWAISLAVGFYLLLKADPSTRARWFQIGVQVATVTSFTVAGLLFAYGALIGWTIPCSDGRTCVADPLAPLASGFVAALVGLLTGALGAGGVVLLLPHTAVPRPPVPSSVDIDTVVSAERLHIKGVRDAAAFLNPKSRNNAMLTTALCLSGGGVRSAAFAIGFLQAFAERHLISRLDYISAVSGGGYALGWWTALLRGTKPDRYGSTPAEITVLKLEAAERKLASSTTGNGALDTDQADPFERRYVRAHGNYLTVRTGLLSTDTWAALFIILRNFIYGLAGLGGLAIIAAVVATDFPRWIGGHSQGQFVWFALVGGIVLSVGWALTSYELARPSFDGSSRARTVPKMMILAFGLWLTAAFLATSAHSRNSCLVAEPAKAFALLVLFVCVVADVLQVIYLMVRRGGSWLYKSSLTWFGLLTVLMIWYWVGTDWVYLHPVPAYFLWVVLLLAHAWEWVWTHCADSSKQVPGDGGNVRTTVTAVVVNSVVIAASLVLAYYLPALTFVFVNTLGIENRRLIVATLVIVMVVGIVIFNALMSVSEGGQADPEVREWWSRWSSEFMILALAAATITVFPAAIGQIAETWLPWALLWAALGAVMLVAVATATGASPAHRLLSRGVGFLALALTLSSAFLAATLVSSKIVELGHLPHFLQLRDPLPILVTPMILVLAVFVLLRSGPNTFSMHEMYRNRLVRAFLGATRPHGRPRTGTGFDPKDDIKLSCLRVGGQSQDSVVIRPFPIWCATVNVTDKKDAGLQERMAASFTFSPLFCGFHAASTTRDPSGSASRPVSGAGQASRAFAPSREHGCEYAGTSREYEREPLTLGAVMATSGAAFSSNSGASTKPERALLLTLLGLRLGRWFPNPLHASLRHCKNDHPASHWSAGLPLFVPKGPGQWGQRLKAYAKQLVFKEAISKCDINSEAVYITDGGHFENLGVYEMIRRRCKLIVAVDAGCDPHYRFADLINLQSKVRTDFGVQIEIAGDDLRDFAAGADGISKSHIAVWSIIYRRDENGEPAERGKLIYCKSSLTGDEDADLLDYRKRAPSFPHLSTINQWFAESTFEAYRALGLHIGRDAGKEFLAA